MQAPLPQKDPPAAENVRMYEVGVRSGGIALLIPNLGSSWRQVYAPAVLPTGKNPLYIYIYMHIYIY